jgi:protease IV
VGLRRAVVRLLAAIGLLVVLSFAAILMLYAVATREPAVPDGAVLVLKPGGDLQEIVPPDVIGQVLGREVRTVRTLTDLLHHARRDPRVSGVLLMPSAFDAPYWGKVQELRDAVVEFRRSGKTVIAFLEYGGDREYFLASAADRVFLLPTTLLDLTGLASHTLFLRGTFDEIGAYPDFLRIGDYKTAPNQFTERGFTPAHREVTEALTEDLYAQVVRGIAEGRGKTETDVRALLAAGPLLPAEALAAGLVDDLAYADELDDLVPELRGESGEMPRIEGSVYQRVRPRSVGIRPRSRIAVIYAVGTIVSGRSRYDPLSGALVGSDTLVEHIRAVREDDSIRAIVLRVDSPGGSAVASDVIWRELILTRDDNPERPLVTSMSDLAASGGYYIAMPGQVIVAQPTTLTGSIGIYSGKFVLDGTLDRLGVSVETIRSAPNADIYDPFAPFTPDQRARIGAYMQSFYATFLEKAAESRRMTPEAVDAVAQGRVWTGAQALAQGLVDELGGLETAITIARARANIPEDEDVELVVYPARRTVIEALAEQFQRDGVARLWGSLGLTPDLGHLAAVASPARLFRRGEPLALMPFTFAR